MHILNILLEKSRLGCQKLIAVTVCALDTSGAEMEITLRRNYGVNGDKSS